MKRVFINQGIQDELAALQVQLNEAEAEAARSVISIQTGLLEGSINNHVYADFDEAENHLMNGFENMALDDCEGAGNCGCEEYSQDFIVDGKEYTATGSFEYNRHSKTYYYIDESSYSYKEKV